MKILSFLRGENLKKNIVNSWKRFPIAIGISLVLSIFLLVLLHGENHLDNTMTDYLLRGVFSLIVTFFLSVGATLYEESQGFSGVKSFLINLLPIVFGGIFFLTFFADLNGFQNFTYFMITLGGIISLLFFSPYIKDIIHNSGTQDIYYSFFYKMSVVFLISGILSGVLFGLGAIGITAVFELFDIGYKWDEIYGDWAIFSLAICAPVFGLTQIPTKEDFTKSSFNQNAFFSFLVQYVAIPFIIIYFIILYAYTVKVLLNFSDWPKGEVSWMVIGFSLFGYITYMFSYIFEAKNKLIETCRKWFPYVVVPQIAMLFYAISLRIGQYDITVNRYFVVVFGIWLLVVSLYLIISKKKYLGYIPAILTLFTIIISVGPWSVYNLPESRQLARLKTNLESANILQGNTIIPLKNANDIDDTLSGEIYDGIKYVCNIGDCSAIKQLFPDQYEELKAEKEKEYQESGKTSLVYYNPHTDHEPSKWEIINAITDDIKVTYYYKDEYINESKYKDYYADNFNDIFPLNTEGYTTLYRVVDHTSTYDKAKNIKINTRTKEAFFYEGGTLGDPVDISAFISRISELSPGSISQEELTFEIERGKFIITHMNIPNPDYTGDMDDDYYYNVDGYFLER